MILIYAFASHRIFPTPVGMVRGQSGCRSGGENFPHARGDGPCARPDSGLGWRFSPRPWGWSVLFKFTTNGFFIFPTPVGMVRFPDIPDARPDHFPHARGDGPS